MAENITKIKIICVCEAKSTLLLLSLSANLVHQTIPVQKLHDGILASLHGLKKIKMATKMAEINMKTASQSCIYLMVYD